MLKDCYFWMGKAFEADPTRFKIAAYIFKDDWNNSVISCSDKKTGNILGALLHFCFLLPIKERI